MDCRTHWSDTSSYLLLTTLVQKWLISPLRVIIYSFTRPAINNDVYLVINFVKYKTVTDTDE